MGHNFKYVVNLCYLINRKDEVLLLYKKRGFGEGKWNGPGGKVRENETVEESMIREVKEETGFRVNSYQKMGELEFIFKDREGWNNYTHVFIFRDFSGELAESEEGNLEWFKKEEFPFDQMWDDDRHWLLRVLGGEYTRMRFYFSHEGKLINYEEI